MGDKSSEGDRRAYEADDQRKYSDAELAQMKKDNEYFEGKKNSHMPNDAKDEQTIANKLAKESKKEREHENKKTLTEEDILAQQDATLPAKMHGNKPSKGAQIDEEIRREEEEILKKKGEFGHRDGKNEPSGKGKN